MTTTITTTTTTTTPVHPWVHYLEQQLHKRTLWDQCILMLSSGGAEAEGRKVLISSALLSN